MSSCSVYGASGDRPSREGDPTEPLTAYAKCKVLVEQDVSTLADATFSPTFMRNATAYGASPRQRFDLVVNDLAATAYLYREIRMSSDGTPWRPFVHVLDIAKAVACVLEAPRRRRPRRDLQRRLGHVELPDPPDRRDHRRSSCPGAQLQLRRLQRRQAQLPGRLRQDPDAAPGLRAASGTSSGAPPSCSTSCARIGFDEQMYRFRGHTRIAQIRHLLDTEQIDDDFFWSTGA